MIYNTVFVKFL